MIAINSDYFANTGDPEPYLENISRAGIPYVHWCHHWNTDFIYSSHEIKQIKRWYKTYDLKMQDLHASAGREKTWYSEKEYSRKAGLELVINRMELCSEVGGMAIVLHPGHSHNPALFKKYRQQLKRSLDELAPVSRKLGVKIALENLPENNVINNFTFSLLDDYPSSFLGICLDSGHANISKLGRDELNGIKDRILVLHLDGNNGKDDQHHMILTGTMDWDGLARWVAGSTYNGCITTEVKYYQEHDGAESEFLKKASVAARKFEKMAMAYMRSMAPGARK